MLVCMSKWPKVWDNNWTCSSDIYDVWNVVLYCYSEIMILEIKRKIIGLGFWNGRKHRDTRIYGLRICLE